MPFIAFEGLDGSGKSTLIERVSKMLTAKAIAHVVTREPGGTPLAEKIRDLLLSKTEDEPTAWVELLLYEAARAQHVERKIRPALNRKQWVLCDRFSASTLAFQCGGRGLDENIVKTIDQIATTGLNPDLTVLLDVSVAQSRQRKILFHLDRLESESEGFHLRVRQAYLKLAELNSTWIVLASANSTPDQLFKQLYDDLVRRRWLPS